MQTSCVLGLRILRSHPKNWPFQSPCDKQGLLRTFKNLPLTNHWSTSPGTKPHPSRGDPRYEKSSAINPCFLKQTTTLAWFFIQVHKNQSPVLQQMLHDKDHSLLSRDRKCRALVRILQPFTAKGEWCLRMSEILSSRMETIHNNIMIRWMKGNNSHEESHAKYGCNNNKINYFDNIQIYFLQSNWGNIIQTWYKTSLGEKVWSIEWKILLQV